jgi:hypothetical protein
MAQWYFPLTDGGQINGISHAGIETFKGTPLKSLAREICQNSLDAITKEGPACNIEFSFFEMKTCEIPGYDTIVETIEKIEKYWKGTHITRINDFVAQAKNCLQNDKISIVRISDFNTSGLTGAFENDLRSKWNNLVLSAGVSNKEEDAGGSFGIGKSAPFACSDLHEVIYSTLDETGVTAYQGVINLASFEKAKNEKEQEIAQGLGYFGTGKNQPVDGLISLDPNFTRKSAGTDIFIIGFSSQMQPNYFQEIIGSVIDSFFYAIWQKKLVVNVGEYILNYDTLPSLSHKFKDSISDYAYEFIPLLYETVPKVHVFENLNFMNLGEIRLLIMLEDGYHKRIARVRNNGMKIDNFQSRINIGKAYSGLLITEGKQINNFLRNIEGPQHTKWEATRAQKPEYARRVLNNLNKFITDSIITLLEKKTDEIIEVDLGKFLPDVYGDEQSENSDKTINTISNTILSVAKKTNSLKKRKLSPLGGSHQIIRPAVDPENGEESFGDGFKKDGDKKAANGEQNPFEGDGQGETPAKQSQSLISIGKQRVICTNPTEGEFYLLLDPELMAEEVSIEIMESTETGSIPAHIIKAETLTGERLRIEKQNLISNLTFTKDKDVKIKVTLDIFDYCAMEVKVYGKLV